MQVNQVLLTAAVYLISCISAVSLASAGCPAVTNDGNNNICPADDDTLLTSSIAHLTPTCVLSDSCYDLASYTTDNVGVTANVSVSCYDLTTHEILFEGFQVIEGRRGIVQVPQNIKGVDCTFGGCFSLFGFERRLPQIAGNCTIEIEKDVCADNSSNNCDINANCITGNISGTYYCECTDNYIGNGSECYPRVPPSLESDWTEREVVLGDNLTISVAVTHGINPYLPLTNITWTHNGNTMENGVTVSHDLPYYGVPVTAMLHIESVSLDHMGRYTLTAVNLAGSSNYTFVISIATVTPGVAQTMTTDHPETTASQVRAQTMTTDNPQTMEPIASQVRAQTVTTDYLETTALPMLASRELTAIIAVTSLLLCILAAALLTLICIGSCLARKKGNQKVITDDFVQANPQPQNCAKHA